MNFRNAIFWTHLAAGIIVGGVILFMSVTGMMLAFRSQIISFAEQGLSTQAIADKNSPVRIFMKKVESFHRWFGVEGPLKPIAHNIKGACSVVFFGMVISGFYLWWPFKKMQFQSGLQGKAQNWNRHNVIGFWSAPFLLIIIVTGLLMAYLPRHDRPQGQKSEMVKIERPQETPERKFRKLIKSLHTGEAGGLVGQIVAFLAAGAAVLLVWTGLCMAWRRFFMRI